MPIRIEFDKINELLGSLFVLTDMTIGLYDDNYVCVESYPMYSKRSRFCSCIDNIPQIRSKCDECDKKYLEEAKKTKKPIIYKCHAGLIDVIFPLIRQNTVFGYITMGQVTNNPDIEAMSKHLRSYCSTLIPLTDDISDACNSITYKSDKHINAAINLLELSVNHILKNNFISPSNKELYKEVTSYIENNIDSDLTIPQICNALNVGRTHLYTEMKKFFPDGIAHFIKSKRLEMSRKLLKNTNLSLNRISESVGFNDYNYFLKSFKKEYGVTPNQFRKNN